MASKYLDASVNGCTGITGISISDSHVAPASNAFIVAEDSTLTVGDSIEVFMGYVGNSPKMFSGYVKNIEVREPERQYSITAANAMTRATDYFLASSTPDNPFTRNHITAENLVGQLLAICGLTNYGYDATSFTFGINTDVEVNLTSIYDYCHFIGGILAWHLYADINGKAWFVNRRPHPMAGDVSIATLTENEILEINYTRSDRDLRNRVVVYGSEGIHADKSASSPYVPAGLWRTVVVSAPGIIDTQSMATQSAIYNLDLLNRLTEHVSVSIIGDPSINCRDVVTINRPTIGVTGDWYVYSCEHNWSKEGYITNLELRI